MPKNSITAIIACLVFPAVLLAGPSDRVIDCRSARDTLIHSDSLTHSDSLLHPDSTAALTIVNLRTTVMDTIEWVADSNIILFEPPAAEDTADLPRVGGKKGHASGGHRMGAIKTQYGVASFYSNKFEGRLTYTDEVFRQKKLTAASNTLPMHTWVRVTNLRNHRSVILRINDKMHPHNRRLIDLSRAAANKLGYAGHGLARVRVDVLGRKRPVNADK